MMDIYRLTESALSDLPVYLPFSFDDEADAQHLSSIFRQSQEDVLSRPISIFEEQSVRIGRTATARCAEWCLMLAAAEK